MIQYQGEPSASCCENWVSTACGSLALLRPDLLAEAQAAGARGRLSSAPTGGNRTIELRSRQRRRRASAQSSTTWLPGTWANVLTSRDLPVTRRLAEQIRRADAQCFATDHWRTRGRSAGCIAAPSMCWSCVACRWEPVSNWPTFAPGCANGRDWHGRERRFGRVIQTQPAPQLREQWKLLVAARSPMRRFRSDQLRLLVYAAMASGTRGLCFESDSPLTATDEATRLRAMTLELLNLELQLVEPWAAAGTAVANVPGVIIRQAIMPGQQNLTPQQQQAIAEVWFVAANTDQAEISGVVLQVDRGHLLLPLWASASGQYVPGQSAGNGISFIVPGVPEANDVNEITLGGLRPLRHQRVTGGLRVNLDELGVTSIVLITQDPIVLSSLTQRLVQIGPRATHLQRNWPCANCNLHAD